MTPPRLQSLAVTGFRGATAPLELTFTPGKHVILIYGENGTGKTTLVDALDFVCNRAFGSIADRSGAAAAANIVALNSSKELMQVTLAYGGRSWRARLQGRAVEVTPDSPPSALILRRSDIVRVVEAAPADRYKALQAFITVPRVEKCEEALRKAYKEADNDVKSAQQEMQAARNGLEALWAGEGKPDANALAWAAARTHADPDALRTRIQRGRALLDQLRATQQRRADTRKNMVALNEAKAEAQRIDAALHAETTRSGGASAHLVVLLQEALHVLQEAEGAATPCPVCGQPQRRDDLRRRIEQSLAGADTLRTLLDAQVNAQARLRELEAVQRDLLAAYLEACHQLADLLEGAPALAAGFDPAPLTAAAGDNAALLKARTALDELAAREAAWAATIDEDQRALAQLTMLYTQMQTLRSAQAVRDDEEALAAHLQAMLAVVEQERKQYVTALLRKIEADIGHFYARIHPGEALGSPALSVKSGVKASLDLAAQFGRQQGVAPGAYYSEAHLDTLGLCVYLAMAKHAGAGASDGAQIVVLDDVLGSVDEAHLERIIALLAEEALQMGTLLITTPARAWYDRLRRAPGLNADAIELGTWSLADGISLSRA